MSAYIVDHDHIDALLSYGVAHEAWYYAAEAKDMIKLTAQNATEVGRILLDENERSVRDRYPHIEPGDLPGTIGEDSASYKFRPWKVQIPALVILKACSAFDYQACETDDYRGTLAAAIINSIRERAAVRLPGYDNAPGWSMTRPANA